MPAIAHLIPRLVEDTNSGSKITATGIGLIVGVGLIPAILLLWIVSWLMFCYPHDRTCWCVKTRKRKARENLGHKGHRTGLSQDTLHEKATYDVQRPGVNYRADSGSSAESTRAARAEPVKAKNTRLSMQSVGSHRSVAIQQQPKPFV